jgi:WD40 repeat protein
MRRITIHRRLIQEHRGLGAEERREAGFSKLRIFDLKLLGAIAAALTALATLSIREPVQALAPARVARGEVGAFITSLASSPTSARIATTNDAGRIAIRAIESGWQIERFLDFPGYAKAVALSPDGQTLAALGSAPGICLWDLRSPGSEPSQIMAVPIRRAKCLRFSPDGRSLAVTSDLDGTIVLWDLAMGRVRTVLQHSSPVAIMAFSPDGRWLATGGRDDWTVRLWDLQSGSRRVLLEDRPGHLAAFAFSPDGTLLATDSFGEHHVRLWDLKTERVCGVFAGHERSVNSVAFSPDGSLLATAGNDGMVGLWTVATGRRRVILDGHATMLRAVTFSPDGRSLVLATDDDDDIRSWDLPEILRVSPGPNSSPMKIGRVQVSTLTVRSKGPSTIFSAPILAVVAGAISFQELNLTSAHVVPFPFQGATRPGNRARTRIPRNNSLLFGQASGIIRVT